MVTQTNQFGKEAGLDQTSVEAEQAYRDRIALEEATQYGEDWLAQQGYNDYGSSDINFTTQELGKPTVDLSVLGDISWTPEEIRNIEEFERGNWTWDRLSDRVRQAYIDTVGAPEDRYGSYGSQEAHNQRYDATFDRWNRYGSNQDWTYDDTYDPTFDYSVFGDGLTNIEMREIADFEQGDVNWANLSGGVKNRYLSAFDPGSIVAGTNDNGDIITVSDVIVNEGGINNPYVNEQTDGTLYDSYDNTPAPVVVTESVVDPGGLIDLELNDYDKGSLTDGVVTDSKGVTEAGYTTGSFTPSGGITEASTTGGGIKKLTASDLNIPDYNYSIGSSANKGKEFNTNYTPFDVSNLYSKPAYEPQTLGVDMEWVVDPLTGQWVQEPVQSNNSGGRIRNFNEGGYNAEGINSEFSTVIQQGQDFFNDQANTPALFGTKWNPETQQYDTINTQGQTEAEWVAAGGDPNAFQALSPVAGFNETQLAAQDALINASEGQGQLAETLANATNTGVSGGFAYDPTFQNPTTLGDPSGVDPSLATASLQQGPATYEGSNVTASTIQDPASYTGAEYDAAQLTGGTGYDAATFGPSNISDAETYASAQYDPAQLGTATTYDATTFDPSIISDAETYTAAQINPAQLGTATTYDANLQGDADYINQYLDPAIQRAQQQAIGNVNSSFGSAGTLGSARNASAASRAATEAALPLLSQAYGQEFAAQQAINAANQGATNAANIYTANADNQTSQINSAALNAALNQNAAAQNAALSQGAQAGNQTNALNQAAQQQVGAFNAGALNQANATNAAVSNQTAQLNNAALNAGHQFNAAGQNAASAYGAQAGNQVNAINQAANQQAGAANAAAYNAANQYGADITNQFDLANVNAANTAFQNNQASQNASNQFNASSQNQADQLNQAAFNNAAGLNQASQNASNAYNASAENNVNTLNQNASNQINLSNQNYENQANVLNASNENAFAQANANILNSADAANANIANQTEQFNLNNQLDWTSQVPNAQSALTQQGNTLGQVGQQGQDQAQTELSQDVIAHNYLQGIPLDNYYKQLGNAQLLQAAQNGNIGYDIGNPTSGFNIGSLNSLGNVVSSAVGGGGAGGILDLLSKLPLNAGGKIKMNKGLLGGRV